MADRRDSIKVIPSEDRYTNTDVLRRASLSDSKTDRRPQPENRSVGDTPHSGVNWTNHAAARAKDILEIGLNDPAGTDLRLIGDFEGQLIGADRQGFAHEKSRVSIKGADRWGEL
jgi:hypothetical protein